MKKRIKIVLGAIFLLIILIAFFILKFIGLRKEDNYIESLAKPQENIYNQYENDFIFEHNNGYFLRINVPKTSDNNIKNISDDFCNKSRDIIKNKNIDTSKSIYDYPVFTINYDLVEFTDDIYNIVFRLTNNNDNIYSVAKIYNINKDEFVDIKDIFIDDINFIKELILGNLDENSKSKFNIVDFGSLINNITISGYGINFYINEDNACSSVILPVKSIESILKYKFESGKFVQVTQEEALNEEPKKLVSNKIIALTLDDGPGDHEDDFIELFKKYDIKATFFYVGRYVEHRKDVVKRVFDAGHEVGNHSYSHPDLTKLSSKEVLSEINDTDDAIENATGKRPLLLRPPYGAKNSKVIELVKRPIICWNIDSMDWHLRPDTDKIVEKVLSEVFDGGILLFHSIYKSSYDAIARIIPKLLDDGYRFVTVSELYKLCNEKIVSGKVYYGHYFD